MKWHHHGMHDETDPTLIQLSNGAWFHLRGYTNLLSNKCYSAENSIFIYKVSLHENCNLLGYHAVSSGNILPMEAWNHDTAMTLGLMCGVPYFQPGLGYFLVGQRIHTYMLHILTPFFYLSVYESAYALFFSNTVHQLILQMCCLDCWWW